MKKIFYVSLIATILFEISNVYFIMPMPGSQEMNGIDIAYFLYHWRWGFRVILVYMMLYSFSDAFKHDRIFSVIAFLFALVTGYIFNFKMAADNMFLQVKNLQLKSAADNKVEINRVIIGIKYNGITKAYPIQYLGYHHQVFDTISGKPIIVTYCTACRTASIFEPIINGKTETFRLVGMDHFNAMFEDKTTKSWWRQATGEAIAGKLKGQKLPEMNYLQTTLKQWLELYPNSLIMQPDNNFAAEYEGMKNYESGNSKGSLTRRDTLPWQRKSWIVGIVVNNVSKAYDWNAFEKQRIIHDIVGNQPILLVMADDNISFFAFERQNKEQKFILNNDTLKTSQNNYNVSGVSYNRNEKNLIAINAHQEYWHSWKTFHQKGF